MLKFIFDVNNKYGYLQSDLLDNIREHFSVENPLAKLSKFKNKRFIQARKYAITPAGRFDIGMLDEIQKYILSLQIPAQVIITDKLREIFKPTYNIKDISPLNKELRVYQKETVEHCLAQGRGTIVIGTAGGKTLIMASIVKTIRDHNNSKTLIIVPTIQLVEQTYTDFIEYGINATDICKWSGDNKLNIDAKIIICSTNILHSKNTDLTILNSIQLLLIDECHTLKKSNEINDILKEVNTNNIYGFTGSMPESKIDQWNVIGKIGPILYEKTSEELRKEKYISDADIRVLRIKYKNTPHFENESKIFNPTEIYEKENNFIHNNSYRNNLIGILCSKLDKNVLLLVDRIEHGEILKNVITEKASNKKVYFIKGEVEVDEREKIRELMENTDDVICIAITKIFSTGINIKNLHYIIFALAGKAKVKIIQSIGRGLRLHENKNKLVIFDITDVLHYSNRHLIKRLGLYEKEKIKYEVKDFKE